MADQLVDAKGLNCPLPILRAKKALKDVAVGGTLQVLATDPGAVKDFEAFCRATGNDLVEFEGGRQNLQFRDQANFLRRGAFDGGEPVAYYALLATGETLQRRVAGDGGIVHASSAGAPTLAVPGAPPATSINA